MIINKIKLYNFGSYFGFNEFDFHLKNKNQTVNIIGGKNGAGKTTLFTAIQVCMYGNFSFGFKTSGKLYFNEIYKLINDKIRLNKDEKSNVEISFSHVDNTDLVDYELKREWRWGKNGIVENFEVKKNGEKLDEEELDNFQKYLLHLIPPELLKLYFFDGEKIADYFLDNNQINVRDALMVLSGNDTFDILYNNVKRVLNISSEQNDDVAKEYLQRKSELDKLINNYEEEKNELADCILAKQELQSEIEQKKSQYTSSGGVSFSEWNDLQNKIKEEEMIRESINVKNKNIATNVLPFLIVSNLLNKVKKQINLERENSKYGILKDTLSSNEFKKVIIKSLSQLNHSNASEEADLIVNSLIQKMIKSDDKFNNNLFDLSNEMELKVTTLINDIEKYDKHILKINKDKIDESLSKSKMYRAKLNNSNIENYDSFVKEISELQTQLNKIENKIESLSELITEQEEIIKLKSLELENSKKSFELYLKNESITSIAGKVLFLLEDLQDYLYTNLLNKVQKDLNYKFEEMIRKKDFFTEIVIDKNFKIHILRQQKVLIKDILPLLMVSNFTLANEALGGIAVSMLKEKFSSKTVNELKKSLQKYKEDYIELPIELNQEKFSSGEKQIFVMSLYWSMMNQSKNTIPFIIDTPFARIDTEHRENITNKFFNTLPGQLFILSTNEELSSHHLGLMENKISNVYMLEYGQDKATHIIHNQYFEV